MVRSKFNELQLTGRCHGSDYLIWHGERERGGRGQTGRPLKMTHHGDKAFGPPVSTGPEQDEGNNVAQGFRVDRREKTGLGPADGSRGQPANIVD